MCRKQNGQNLNAEQISLLRQELMKLGEDDRERLAIANKATVSGWKSFYPIKRPPKKEKVSQKKNSVSDYPHRQYDYDAIKANLFNQ